MPLSASETLSSSSILAAISFAASCIFGRSSPISLSWTLPSPSIEDIEVVEPPIVISPIPSSSSSSFFEISAPFFVASDLSTP